MTSMRPAAFGDYQLEIYLAGLNGILPGFPMAYPELEARAAQALPPSVLSYVAGRMLVIGSSFRRGTNRDGRYRRTVKLIACR